MRGQINEDLALTLRWILFNKSSYPESTVHYFAENKLIQQYNEIQLDKITYELVRIQAIDEVMKFKLVDPQITVVYLKLNYKNTAFHQQCVPIMKHEA